MLEVPEDYLTVNYISKEVRIDRHVTTKLFENEEGVLVIGSGETKKGRRKYRQLRIPRAVYNRVLGRLRNRRGRTQ